MPQNPNLPIELVRLHEPIPQNQQQDDPTDEEIADAIIQEMGIQHLSRDEVLNTVREFFRGRARKQAS